MCLCALLKQIPKKTCNQYKKKTFIGTAIFCYKNWSFQFLKILYSLSTWTKKKMKILIYKFYTSTNVSLFGKATVMNFLQKLFRFKSFQIAFFNSKMKNHCPVLSNIFDVHIRLYSAITSRKLCDHTQPNSKLPVLLSQLIAIAFHILTGPMTS